MSLWPCRNACGAVHCQSLVNPRTHRPALFQLAWIIPGMMALNISLPFFTSTCAYTFFVQSYCWYIPSLLCGVRFLAVVSWFPYGYCGALYGSSESTYFAYQWKYRFVYIVRRRWCDCNDALCVSCDCLDGGTKVNELQSGRWRMKIRLINCNYVDSMEQQ